MIASFTLKFPLKKEVNLHRTNFGMTAMKEFQLSIEQDHAKTQEPVRYAKKNTLQVYMDLCLKRRANRAMMVLILIIQLLKVIAQVLVVQELPLVK